MPSSILYVPVGLEAAMIPSEGHYLLVRVSCREDVHHGIIALCNLVSLLFFGAREPRILQAWVDRLHEA